MWLSFLIKGLCVFGLQKPHDWKCSQESSKSFTGLLSNLCNARKVTHWNDVSLFSVVKGCLYCHVYLQSNYYETWLYKLQIIILFQMITNFKNTVHGFKKFHGRAFDDPFVQAEKNKLPYSLHKLPNGNTAIKVKHCTNLQHLHCFVVLFLSDYFLLPLHTVSFNHDAYHAKLVGCTDVITTSYL